MTVTNDDTKPGGARPATARAGPTPKPRSTAHSTSTDLTIADLSEQLMSELGDRIDLSIISGTVLACRAELGARTVEPSSGSLERLARYRLSQIASQALVASQRPSDF